MTTLINGLLSYYTADTGSGTTLFDDVGTNNGTLNNTRIWTASGKINGGLDFSLGNDNINLGNIFNFSGTTNFSIGAWIYYDGVAGYIIGKFAPGISGQWIFSVNTNNQFQLHREVSPFSLISTTVLNLNQWNYCVGTYDGTAMRLYHNGILVGGPLNSGSVLSNNRNVRIGSNDNNGSYITSRLDEIGIWNRALTQAEVTELYNSGLGLQYPFTQPTTKKGNIFFGFGGGKELAPVNPVPVPLAYYTLDESSGTTAFDSVGSNDFSLSNVSFVAGKINNGGDFNGTSNGLTRPNFEYGMATAFTICMWAKLDNDTQPHPLFHQDNNGGTRGILFRTINRRVNFIRFNGATEVGRLDTPENVWDINEWTHFGITFDNTVGSKIYVNGVVQASDTVLTNTGNSTSICEIGKYITFLYLKGIVDEVLIDNIALSQSQMEYLAQGNRPNLS